MTSTNETYDAVVIGGGPGGYVAGIRLGQLGLHAAVVERESFGGVCLNWGCIPSKAIIQVANLAQHARESSEVGLSLGEPQLDAGRMNDWKNGIVAKLTGGVEKLLEGNGVERIRGVARFVDAFTLAVSGAEGERLVHALHIIIATGASPVQLPDLPFDGELVISAKEAVDLRVIPRHLVVIGGGVIGLELGTAYRKLGAEVTVVELLPDLLPGIDKDLTAMVRRRLKQLGVTVHTGARATGLERREGGAELVVQTKKGEERVRCDKILVAVGFRPNSEGLDLAAAGVLTDERGFIVADAQRRTNVEHIFAIGDVTGPPFLAHKASAEGEVAAEVIEGKPAAFDPRAIPAAVFTDPEIATVGWNEAQAREAGYDVAVGKFPFAANGRALASRAGDGFVKAIVDKSSEEILGLRIVGEHASELIAEGALAIEMAGFVEDLVATVHTHPTLAECVAEAVRAARGEAIHILNK